jgi:pimeloyl-ACP methyl ester carboxylesterase
VSLSKDQREALRFSQTDFTDDLRKISIPVLVMHGDDDQIVPYADAGPLSAKLLKNGTLKTYKGCPHGMPTTEAPTINADLLAFIRPDRLREVDGIGPTRASRIATWACALRRSRR